MKLTPTDTVNIIEAFENLTPVAELANEYGMTRQGVYKVLRRNGVDTKKKQLDVSCTACGNIIKRPKCRIRKQKNHFCNYECYYAFLEAGNGNPYIHNRHGQRIARRVVSEYFELQDGYVVHHEDRNTLNNLPYNLKVFACQGDHIRYHRLGPDYVQPIWKGTDI
jgi:hypothetical protein